MIKRISYYILTLFLALAVILLVLHREKEYPNDSSRTVYIKKSNSGFELIRNGKPFYIKGASGKGFIKELYEAGGNTLRLYDTINLQKTLDEAQKYNIAVIIDIPLPRFNRNMVLYSDHNFRKEIELKIKNLVNRHKDHPSLLFWNLGNELIFPIPYNKKRKNFINFYNSLIELIHKEDKNHLVSTTVPGASIRQSFNINQFSPGIDLIGYNAFSIIERVSSNEKKLSNISSTVPYYISEWGINGPWEVDSNRWKAILEPSSSQKGQTYKRIYNQYIETDEQSLGSLAFYWGHKIEGTPTWFNVFDKNDRKSQTYYSLAEVWKDILYNDVHLPKIETFTLDGITDNDLVFGVEEIVEAEIHVKGKAKQKLEIEWELYENGWELKKWHLNEKLNELVLPIGDTNKNRVRLKMPKKEGAYRLFVYVYDQSNHFATENIPFYILNQNE